MTRFADEEPDVDEGDPYDPWYDDDSDGCDRCGLAGHSGDQCTTVVPHLLRQHADRRRRAG